MPLRSLFLASIIVILSLTGKAGALQAASPAIPLMQGGLAVDLVLQAHQR